MAFQIKTLHTGSHQLGGARKEYELLVSNYDLRPGDAYVEKAVGGSDPRPNLVGVSTV